jgi:hypothetical protein
VGLGPPPGGALGLWRAPDPAPMNAILASLPLPPWTTVQSTPPTGHARDPVLSPRLTTGEA